MRAVQDICGAPVTPPGTACVQVIIVSYNTCADTLAAIASVQAQSPRPDLVVLDNASTDGSAEAIAAAWPDITLIRSDTNLGFGRAVNLAAARSTAPWILLLNSDAALAPGALAALQDAALSHPGHGIYGGRTLHANGTLNPDSCGGTISPWSMTCHALGLNRLFRGWTFFDGEAMPHWRRDSLREVDVVFGCFALIARDLWDRLGGFDPRYWLYGEDNDLCLRAAALTGRRPLFVPQAVAQHIGGASSGRSAAYRIWIAKGRATVMRQHWPARWRWLVRPLGLIWAGNRALAERLSERLGARRGSSAPVWAEVWRRRAEWLGGYEGP